jgi:hypothetical protein
MEEKVLLNLVWRLAMREHKMLHEVLPVTEEMGTCLRGDVKPDPELLRQWLKIEHDVHRSFGLLQEEIAGIQQMAQNSPHNIGT